MENQDTLPMTYAERAGSAQNAAGKKLLQLMDEKQTNLSAGFDTSSAKELLQFARKVGEEIAVFKTHVDMLSDFDAHVTGELKELSREQQFMLFEDRKFGDIGNTVKLQYGAGLYKIADWADLVNAHAVPGEGVLKGLYEVAKEEKEPRGCLLLAQMTSAGNLATGAYTRKAVEMAHKMPEFACGFIGAGSNAEQLKELRAWAGPGMIIFAPGIQLAQKADHLGQQYATPESAIAAGADVIFAGRGISGAGNPKEAAQKYRALGWQSYENRIKK